MHPGARVALGWAFVARASGQTPVQTALAASIRILAVDDDSGVPTRHSPRGTEAHCRRADQVINILFTVEAFFRILAIGSFFKYLKSFWNIFDFSLTSLGYLSYLDLSSSGSTGGIRALRALRALRPLRTISRFKALKAIVSCFLQAHSPRLTFIQPPSVFVPCLSLTLLQWMSSLVAIGQEGMDTAFVAWKLSDAVETAHAWDAQTSCNLLLPHGHSLHRVGRVCRQFRCWLRWWACSHSSCFSMRW